MGKETLQNFEKSEIVYEQYKKPWVAILGILSLFVITGIIVYIFRLY